MDNPVNCVNFITILDEEHFRHLGLSLIGYFPYETARLQNIRIPVEAVKPIMDALYDYDFDNKTHICSNKCVYLFRSTAGFGSKVLAMMYYDNTVMFGCWKDVIDR